MSTATLTRPAVAGPRAGLTVGYCRISLDGDGRGLGVERQTEDVLRLAGFIGADLSPQNVIVENDASGKPNRASASSYSTKPREKFDAMIARVLSGEISTVLAYSMSRLTRDMDEREALLRLRHAGATIVTAQGQRIYPGMSASEVHVIRMLGTNDTAESDLISERVTRAFEGNAAAGTPHGPRAYGWIRGRAEDGTPTDTIDEGQAAVLREVARRMIEGEATLAIVRDLNARGIPAPRGGRWSTTILTKLMLRERNAGRRVHRGEVVGSATWEPLYDDDTHAAVVAHLRDPARLKPRAARRHLLSGLLVCGRCESTRVWVVHGARNAQPAYFCKDCRGVRRRQEPVDLYVIDMVCDRLARPDALDWLAQDAGALAAARANVATLRGRSDEIADMAATGEMTRDQVRRANAALQPQIAEAEAAVEAARPLPHAVRQLVGLGSVEATRAAWDLLSLDAKRDAIRSLMTVTVLPAKTRKFHPDWLRIDWLTA